MPQSNKYMPSPEELNKGSRAAGKSFRDFLKLVAVERPLWQYYFGSESPLKWDVLRTLDLVMDELKSCCSKAPGLLLDAGCGIGVYQEKLRAYPGIRPYGADLAIDNLIKGKANAPGNCFVNANIEQLPFKDEVFDYAIAVEVLEHVLDPHKMLGQLHDVLKDGGMAIIVVPLAPRIPFITALSGWLVKLMGSKQVADGSYKEHMRLYDEKTFVKEVEKLFIIKKSIRYNLMTFFVALAFRISDRLGKSLFAKPGFLYKIDLLMGHLIYSKGCFILKKKV